MKNIPPFVKNFYFVTGAFFLLWMAFIDSNDFIRQYSLNQKLENLKEEKAFYQKKIKEVKKERHELLKDQALLEKFAREKYFMKKPSEDLYVIVEKDKK